MVDFGRPGQRSDTDQTRGQGQIRSDAGPKKHRSDQMGGRTDKTKPDGGPDRSNRRAPFVWLFPYCTPATCAPQAQTAPVHGGQTPRFVCPLSPLGEGNTTLVSTKYRAPWGRIYGLGPAPGCWGCSETCAWIKACTGRKERGAEPCSGEYVLRGRDGDRGCRTVVPT